MYLPGYRMPQQRRVYGFAQASESGTGPLKALANAEYIEYLSNRNMPYIHGEYVACEVLAFISALAGGSKALRAPKSYTKSEPAITTVFRL